jgi:hypothetical protein
MAKVTAAEARAPPPGGADSHTPAHHLRAKGISFPWSHCAFILFAVSVSYSGLRAPKFTTPFPGEAFRVTPLSTRGLTGTKEKPNVEGASVPIRDLATHSAQYVTVGELPTTGPSAASRSTRASSAAPSAIASGRGSTASGRRRRSSTSGPRACLWRTLVEPQELAAQRWALRRVQGREQ